ncbi:MAG: hypothetical protein JRN11_06595 [Nitrososphaerota archaeon]|nr:hypothetical protein [Nitrososphaerota archaeon]MDG7014299.1 hypothetical protein [Nitrososphaerota archaeon]MDG7026399.1 hypothetical protein [Nitrososphaerota archaeon]
MSATEAGGLKPGVTFFNVALKDGQTMSRPKYLPAQGFVASLVHSLGWRRLVRARQGGGTDLSSDWETEKSLAYVSPKGEYTLRFFGLENRKGLDLFREEKLLRRPLVWQR